MNDYPDFVAKDLVIRKGDNNQSIIVTDDFRFLGTKYADEFNLDEVVYVNRDLRFRLRNLLVLAGCQLKIRVTS